MAFYRKRMTYDELAPHVAKFREFLRLNCPVVREAGDDGDEVFYVDRAKSETIRKTFEHYYSALTVAGFITCVPISADYSALFLYFNEKANGPKPTVTPTHIRMPKLSYMITLCPEDFFALLRLISTAKNTNTKDSLALNPPAAGIMDLPASPLAPFFMLLRTNYRMNPEYCDKKWTPRDAIAYLADLEPTRDNQLSAMQYLTALQNPDLLYFPIETSIELELDWEQISDDYCAPTNSLS